MEEQRKDAEVQQKQPYQPPQLIFYGVITEITQRDGGTMGMNDGGAGNDKTGF
ncbi:MAG TPA: hypothetical protein VF131_19030 [Blastocatellia bacterium]|nr:hypothetical protein [Blastocatellia bacterium]